MLEYFKPVSSATLGYLHPKGIVSPEHIHLAEQQPPIKRGSIWLVGLTDERSPAGYPGNARVSAEIRRQLYALAAFDRSTIITDLGDLSPGEKAGDTAAALKIITEEAMQHDSCLILLGGCKDAWHFATEALGPMRKNLELAAIDKSLDLSPDSALQKMILGEPNYLFNLSVIGLQSHHVWIEAREVFHKLGFDIMSLGALRGDISEAEVYIRNADLLLVDMSVMSAAFAPGVRHPGPNGLTGEDMCRLARFAGAGNNCRLLWLSELDPALDPGRITAQLAAQIVWYFAEGLANRKVEVPTPVSDRYQRYLVPLLEGGHELVFYKSNETGRWWVEIPHPRDGKENRAPILFPCSYHDYQCALRNEVPDRWWRTVHKYS